MQIRIPHVLWPAQEVREWKIDHTNAIYLHSVEPEVRNKAVGWHCLHIDLQKAQAYSTRAKT